MFLSLSLFKSEASQFIRYPVLSFSPTSIDVIKWRLEMPYTISAVYSLIKALNFIQNILELHFLDASYTFQLSQIVAGATCFIFSTRFCSWPLPVKQF